MRQNQLSESRKSDSEVWSGVTVPGCHVLVNDLFLVKMFDCTEKLEADADTEVCGDRLVAT